MHGRMLVVAALFTAATAFAEPVAQPGRVIDRIPVKVAPSQSYAAYLPSSYDPAGRAPALLIFDPRKRGAAAAEIFRPAAERFGWVLLSSNETESDSRDAANFEAVNALLTELPRYAVDGRRIYAAGFSGGGILALILGSSSQAIGGVIQCGGRLPDGFALRTPNYPHWGAAGRTDFNFVEMHEVDAFIAKAGQPHRLEIFDGTHEWISAELATRAVAWHEIEAMRREHRAKDPAIVDDLYRDDLQIAARLRSGNRLVDLLAHCESMERTYRGLRETPELVRLLDELRKDPALKTAQRDARKALNYEETSLRSAGAAISLLRSSEVPPSSRQLSGQMRVKALLEAARGEGAIAEAARRVLASVYTQMAYYVPGDALRSGDVTRAARALEVAVEVRPDSAPAHYNLACAYARIGSRSAALASLERAVECGFRDAALIERDEDLASIRGEERYRTALERVKGAK